MPEYEIKEVVTFQHGRVNIDYASLSLSLHPPDEGDSGRPYLLTLFTSGGDGKKSTCTSLSLDEVKLLSKALNAHLEEARCTHPERQVETTRAKTGYVWTCSACGEKGHGLGPVRS